MKLKLFIITLISICFSIVAQKDITKEDIFFNRTFSQDWVFGLNSMRLWIEFNPVR